MAKNLVAVAVSLEAKTLPKAQKKANRLFGPRGFSRYIRHLVAQDIKQQ